MFEVREQLLQQQAQIRIIAIAHLASSAVA
jgi:hypothetical protein